MGTNSCSARSAHHRARRLPTACSAASGAFRTSLCAAAGTLSNALDVGLHPIPRALYRTSLERDARLKAAASCRTVRPPACVVSPAPCAPPFTPAPTFVPDFVPCPLPGGRGAGTGSGCPPSFRARPPLYLFRSKIIHGRAIDAGRTEPHAAQGFEVLGRRARWGGRLAPLVF